MGGSGDTRRRRRRRRNASGVALFIAVVAVAGDTFLPAALRLPAGVAAWTAGLLIWPDVASRTRRQALVLIAIGVTGMVMGAFYGQSAHVSRALAGNAGLIAMLAAVSFLKLIALPPGGEDQPPPTGRPAVLSTLVGLHLFGAVVNLSAVFIMAQRMASDGRIDLRQVRLLTRGFSAGAFWSPFFAAMAAALTFAPGARLGPLVLAGLPLAAASLTFTGVELVRARERPETFAGYPMNWGSLWLPGVLALIILGLHAIRPDLSILGVIALIAPTLSFTVLWLRRQGAPATFGAQIVRGLPLMANELALFLAAGVMAAGLESLLLLAGGWTPFGHFGGAQAGLVLCTMVALAIVGVHPVIGIALFATLLAPLSPDPTLLAMTFLAGWAIGVSVSPLGGMNLAIQGAYGVRGTEILRQNAVYGAVMTAIASAAFMLYTTVFGIG